MKVRFYMTFKLSGFSDDDLNKLESTEGMVWFDASFPAVPRVGEGVRVPVSPLGDNVPIRPFEGIVKKVTHHCMENKKDVFFPVVYLEYNASSDRSGLFDITRTLENNVNLLKTIVCFSRVSGLRLEFAD